MLSRARAFFAKRNILEVDCPALTQNSPVDKHIDIMAVSLNNGEKRYLHSSPEYGMKRLLAAGSGDIYQLSHVFREGEFGSLHNPEFMMAEWYRLEIPFETFIKETLDFIHLFLGQLPEESFTYREIFKKHTSLDYVLATKEDLIHCAHAHQIHFASDLKTLDEETLIQLLLGSVVEPQLGKDCLTIITDFPGKQAALSKTKKKGDEEVAMRFEVYFRGIELANGYHELSDPIEQRRRQIEANQKRVESGKSHLPIDEYLIAALSSGFPDCCGVAVGFDRLMMLRQNECCLASILPFSWDKA